MCSGESGSFNYIKTVENPSGFHVVFNQVINSVPVLGSETVMSINKNNCISFVYNGYQSGIAISTTPLVDLNVAIEVARNTFNNPNFDLLVPIKSKLAIYIDSMDIPILVWKLNILPQNDGDWYILVNAVNSDLVLKENIEIAETGNGTVWDPDVATYLEDITLPDNNDEDYPALQPAYTNVQLEGLIPENDINYLRGDFAYSYDISSPNDPVTGLPTPDFYFNRSQNGFEETNCYYHLDKFIRYIHSLNFYPEWDNLTTENQYDIVFDARGMTERNASYSSSEDYIKYGVPSSYPDAGEDQSVIIHELGHAMHDAFLIGGIDGFVFHPICRGVSEGISDYFGIDYRRQLSHFRPNDRCNWFWPDLDPTIGPIPVYNFQNHWYNVGFYEKMQTWASTLMDLEYYIATSPSQGYRLGRDVVVTNQLAAFTYITGNATTDENVLAMYQADLDIYSGAHLREYIDAFHNRLLFDDQNVFDNIAQNTTWSGFKKINDEISITAGNTLEIEPFSVIVMDGKLNVNNGAELIIGNNVLFIGYENEHMIIVDGICQFGQGVSFFGVNADELLQLILNYTYGEFNNVDFENCKIEAKTAYWLNIVESNFSNSYLEAGRGNILVDGCEFDNSNVWVMYTPFQSNSVQISDNTFTNFSNGTAIIVESYPNFVINGNNVSGCGTGIKIYNSGSANGTKLIQMNTLYENYYAGIMVYNTYATIKLNDVTQNGYGVCCLNRSNVELLGVKDPESIDYTQQIEDCVENEVYATKGSFPHKFRYNSIVDNDGDCLVLYTGSEEGLDVRYNYWGSGFEPDYDLCPTGSYIWDPVWNPGGNGNEGDAEAMYNDAKNAIAQENFATAKSEFLQIVLQYPTSMFAQASLKELFLLEELLGCNYNDLKNYYSSEPVIQSNQDLKELADHLINFCEIKLENWPVAIDCYENTIQNPQAFEDSIFAIIDLGHTYFLMEQSGYKSSYSGTMTEHIPVSRKQYDEKRDYLISLLPGDMFSRTLKENIAGLNDGELLQNVPNPFKGSTQIWYKLKNKSEVQLNVYNSIGQLISTINEGSKTKGTHYIDFNSDGLKNGIFFYSISINGLTTDSKKMTILK